MCRCYLGSQQRQLRIIQRGTRHGPEIGSEVCRGDRRDEGCYVGEEAVEGGDRGVVEVVAGRDGLDLIEWSIAGADDGHSAEGEFVGGVDSREPAAGLSNSYQQGDFWRWRKGKMGAVQWLESFDNIWPSSVSRGLDVNEEVQSLSAIGVKHSVVSWGSEERAVGRVLAVQRIQDRIDV